MAADETEVEAAPASGGPCPACGAPMRPWREARSSDPALAGDLFQLELCPRCATARTLGPLPPSEVHETGYYGAPTGLADRLIEPLRRLAEVDRLRPLRRLGRGERVLEVGSGDGRFLARLHARGVEVVGIEPSERARARSARRGIVAIPGGVENATAPEVQFDALIAWHSLEHLEVPAEALKGLRRWIRPGGLLVVAVPNRTSLQARIGGDRWFHQDVPRHRTHFSASGAREIIADAGFAVARVSHLVVEQNSLGMWQTLLNRMTSERDVAYRALKRDPTLKRAPFRDLLVTAIVAIPLAPLAIALELAAGVARSGGTIVVEARAR